MFTICCSSVDFWKSKKRESPKDRMPATGHSDILYHKNGHFRKITDFVILSNSIFDTWSKSFLTLSPLYDKITFSNSHEIK